MAYVVKCILCGTLSLHHLRCVRAHRTFPCPKCCPNFDKTHDYPLDSWVVIQRLGFSPVPREYLSCCRKMLLRAVGLNDKG